MIDVSDALDRFDTLFAELEAQPEGEAKDRVYGLLESLDAIHRPGIIALVERLRASSPAALYAALDDPAITLLLDMYGLSTQAALDQTMAILAEVVPYIESHGGSLRVVAVDDGVVTVQLAGTCSGCPASSVTLRNLVERTLRQQLRGFERLEVLEPTRSPKGPLLPMLGSTPPISWHDVGDVSDYPAGRIRGMRLAGHAVLVAYAGGDAQAFENRDPETGQPLDSAKVSDGVILVSPWSNTAYDLRTGKAVDGSRQVLRRLPAHVQDGRLIVGILRQAAAA